jgi:hypothetical protein
LILSVPSFPPSCGQSPSCSKLTPPCLAELMVDFTTEKGIASLVYNSSDIDISFYDDDFGAFGMS